jgi:adenylate cyclase
MVSRRLFFFTLVRLWLAFRRHMPGWFVSISVIMDMTLLMGMIWSFHLQYNQPASFYLKVPTLLYVFIFIALRALRFDVQYIVLAGVTAAAGWLLLMGYVFSVDLFDEMITRDYVAYMTSNKILIGAEIDKIVSILVVTGILALAVMRARALLVQSVRETAATQSLSRFFDTSVAKEIADSGIELTPGSGMARDAAIVSVDIRGFTPLTQTMTPGQLVRFITEYQSRMVPVITPHGGAIDKFLGDGLLVTFGAVKKSATYAADALRAIDSIMAAADSWNAERQEQGLPPVGIGAAAASGSIVCGVIGDAERLEYTVLGDAVNVSAKLESHTKQEKVRALATAQAYEAALVQGFDSRPAHRKLVNRSVGGINAPMDIVVLAE